MNGALGQGAGFMPKPIINAVRLMYLAVTCYFGAVVLAIAQIGPRARGDVQFLLFVETIILCAIYCLLVSRISSRGKFSLIIMTILGVTSVINVLFNIGNIFSRFGNDPFVYALDLGANCLHVAAVVLLFVPASRRWLWSTEAA
jgi:hypothetical protein